MSPNNRTISNGKIHYSQNTFANEAIDVAFKAPSGQVSAHFNNFNNRSTGDARLALAHFTI